MKVLMPIGAAVLALAVTASAQDTKVKSRTKIKADDAKVVTMTGCLRQDVATGTYMLTGTMAAGKELKSETTVKTDVHKDDVTTKSRTKTKVDDGAVATTGAMSTFTVVPQNDVDLAAYVGRQVELSAVVVERGHGDADVKIEHRSKVEREHAPDTKARSKTKVEVPRSPYGSYSVVEVKPLPGACPGP